MLFSNFKSWKKLILSQFPQPSRRLQRRKPWRKSVLSSAPVAGERLEDRLLLAADINNWYVSSATPSFGESGYAYVAQSFVSQGGYANELTFQLSSSVGPDDTEFRVLLTDVLPGATGVRPNTVLFESDTLVKAAGTGPQVFNVDLGGLKLYPGATYTWVLDSAIAFDGLNGTSRVGMNSNYPDGNLMVLNAGSKSRDINFSQDWINISSFDLAFRMTFSDTGNTIPGIDLNGWEEFGKDLTRSYTEGQQGWTRLTDSNNSTIFDPDGGPAGSNMISSLTVAITNLQDGADERLFAPVFDTNINSDYDSATGVLSLTGNDTIANYNRILHAIWYRNDSQNPTTTTRVIEFVANDGEKQSTPARTTLAVVGKNDAPEIDLNGAGEAGVDFSATFTEGAGPVALVGAAAEVNDPDGGVSSSAVTGSGDVFVVSTNGVVKRINLTTRQVMEINDGTLIQSARGVVVDPASGDLYVTDYGGQQIVRVDPVTGQKTRVTSGFSAWGIDIDQAGNLIVSDVSNRRILQIDPQTGYRTVIASLSFTPGDLTLDADGDLAVIPLTGTGIVLNPGQRSQTILSGNYNDNSFNKITTDAAGNFIVSSKSSRNVYQIDSQTGDTRMIGNPSQGTDLTGVGVAIDAFNNVVVTDPGANRIVVYDRTGKIETPIYTSQFYPYGIDVDTAVFQEGLTSATVNITNLRDGANEQIMVDTSGTSIVAVYDEITGTLTLTGDDSVENYQQVLKTVQYNNLSGDPDTTDRVIEFVVSDGFVSSNTATTTVSVIAVNSPPALDLNGADQAGIDYATTLTINAGPVAITDSDLTLVETDGGLFESAVAYNGKIYVANNDGSVIELDPDSGAQTVLSSGALVQYVNDVAIDPVSGDLFIADYAGRQIVKVDTTTGVESQLIANITPIGIDFDQAGNLFFSNVLTRTIYQADSVTGARTLYSTTDFYPEMLVVDHDGSLIVTNRQYAMLVRNPGLSNQEIISRYGALTSATGMALDEDSGEIYLSGNTNGGFITRVNPDTGLQSTVVSGVYTLRITNGFDGDFFTVGSPNMVRILDPDTGTLTSFASAGNIYNPFGIAAEQGPSTPLGSIVSATVSITNLLNGSDELLTTDTSGTGIVASYDSIIGTLSLTGEGTAEEYRTVLSRITYDNLSQTPNFTDRVIEFVVDDGMDTSTVAHTTIHLESIPVADAGGPYTIDEGDQITLDATGSYDLDGDPLNFAWDLDNDGLFDDAVGATPSLDWSQLVSLGLADDGTFPLRVQLDDGTHSTISDLTTLTINNVAPDNLVITNPLGLGNPGAAGASSQFGFSFEDPGTEDVHTVLVNWGDGSSDTFVLPVGDRIFSVGHAYGAAGIFSINAVITDDDSDSTSSSSTAFVTGVAIVNVDGENVLQIVGSPGNDDVSIKAYKKTQISVSTSFSSNQAVSLFAPADIDRIEAVLGAGDDELKIDRFVTLPALIDAGSGNDIVTAGGGSAIILGGEGDDLLTGGLANDLIFGGLGNDEIKGNRGDDLIFGGIFSQTVLPGSIVNDRADLLAAQAIWTDSSLSLEERKTELEGLDDFYTRLIDDGDLDSLQGNLDADWYLMGASDIAKGFNAKKGDVN